MRVHGYGGKHFAYVQCRNRHVGKIHPRQLDRPVFRRQSMEKRQPPDPVPKPLPRNEQVGALTLAHGIPQIVVKVFAKDLGWLAP